MPCEDDVLTLLQCVPETRRIDEELLRGRTACTDEAFRQMEEFLNGERREFQIAYRLRGTQFQRRVWSELAAIPYGATATYGQLAARIGNPRASRAVGMANNRNPLHLIVPCHRCIGADSSLTGYAGGLPMKAYLLEMERKNAGRTAR